MKNFRQSIHHWDEHAFLWCHDHWGLGKQHSHLFFKSVRGVSHSGDGWLYALIAITLIAFNVPASTDFLVLGLLAFSLEVPVYIYLKSAFKRNRPEKSIQGFHAVINPSDEFSFPSGHTAAAFVMVVITAYVFPSFIAFSLCWAALIGLSRVLLGVHYPGDIVAGALLGTLCGLVGISLFKLF